MTSKRAADFSPNKKDLNPIEIASRDEIAALAVAAHEMVAQARLRERAALQEIASTRPECIRTT